MYEQTREAASMLLQPLHTVPTHLSGDSVVSFGTLDLSSRQVVTLLIGGSLAASVWEHTIVLTLIVPPVGLLLHWLLLILLIGGVLTFTFGHAAGRSLDVWCLVLLAYLGRPRILLWTRTADAMQQAQIGPLDNATSQAERKNA